MAKEDHVAMTSICLGVILAMQAVKRYFIADGILQEKAGMPVENWLTRCNHLFTDSYAVVCDKAGLKRNEITFRNILDVDVPQELLDTPANDLPGQWVFDPWAGMGRGAIFKVPQEIAHYEVHVARRDEPGTIRWTDSAITSLAQAIEEAEAFLQDAIGPYVESDIIISRGESKMTLEEARQALKSAQAAATGE